MATFSQTTVEPLASTGAPGKRDDTSLKSSFPASPIHSGPLTHDVVTDQGKIALNGHAPTAALPVGYEIGIDGVTDVGGNVGGSGTYWCTTSDVNLNYTLINTFIGVSDPIVYGAALSPVSAHVPGLGGENAYDLESSPAPTRNEQWGSGTGSALTTEASTLTISGQTIGSYTKGSPTPLTPTP